MKLSSFNKLSIKNKVTVLIILSSTLALLLAGTGLALSEWITFRDRATNNMKALKGALAVNLQVPPGWLDVKTARETLESLAGSKDIYAAYVYSLETRTGSNTLLHAYIREANQSTNAIDVPPLPAADGVFFENGRARLVETILYGTTPVSRLDIHSDLESMHRDLRQRFSILLWVMVLLLIIGVSGAMYLQKSFTAPLLQLASTAREVTERNDYSLRAPVTSQDETGQLAATFNRMLEAIQNHGEALYESEARFRSVWENSVDAMMLTDKEGVTLAVNPAFCRLTGLKPEAMLHKPFTTQLAAIDADDLLRQYRLQFARKSFPTLFEQKLTFASGRSADVEMTDSFIELGSHGVVLLTIFRDITERKQAEEQLRMLSQAVQQSPTAVLITNPNGDIQYVNRKFIELTGYSWEEVYGKNPRILKSGETSVEVYKELWEALRSDRRWTGEFHNRRKNGTLFWALMTIAPIKDFAGKTAHILADMEDITERKQAEENKAILEAQLRQAQKMEALGTLAGGIAHDFNNILGAIIGYTELAQMDVQDRPEVVESLNQVILGSNRARDLVRQILAFSRRSKQQRKPLRLQPIILEVLKLLRSTLPATIEINSMIEDDAPVVYADPTQLHQVLMNLSTNASHAMKGKPGRLTVGVGRTYLDEDFTRTRPEMRPGTYARLFVSDTGHGMDSNTIKRIFDPFFTTKEPGEGTGLGLSVVDGIVKDHEGTILVESQPGVGTTFQIFLPAHQSEAAEETPVAQDFRPGNGQHVLVVDDEPALCKTAQKVLERFGYHVTTYTHPTEALGLFRSEAASFDIVITDFSMPGMTGVELAVELLKIRPDTPIVLTSGFVGPQTSDLASKIGIREVAPKPISPTALGQIITRILGLSSATDRDHTTT